MRGRGLEGIGPDEVFEPGEVVRLVLGMGWGGKGREGRRGEGWMDGWMVLV